MRSISGGIDVDCRLEEPRMTQLLAYWQRRCRAPGQLPGRADFDPADFLPLLPHIFLIDVQLEPRAYRYRLCGTGIAEAYGLDLTGKALDEVFSDIFRKAVTTVFNHVVEHRAPLRTYGTLAWRETQHHRFEGIQMPLAADGAKVDMILGAMAYE
jgi:hypothetical protein